jgi:hypothetical protein
MSCQKLPYGDYKFLNSEEIENFGFEKQDPATTTFEKKFISFSQTRFTVKHSKIPNTKRLFSVKNG